MEIYIIAIAILCVIAAMIKILMGKPSSNAIKSNLTETQTQWLQKVGSLFGENKAMPFLDVYVECGMPQEIAYSKDSNAIAKAFPFDKNETKHDGYDVFMAYQFAIAERYDLQKHPLRIIDAIQYGLNLQNDETIYHLINSVTLYSEKIVSYNMAYSGMRWQSGLLRAGTMSVIGNEIKRFVAMDIGRLFITNQRILFVGKQKSLTKSIPIKRVLYYNLYQDGVLVNIPNSKPTLFKFETGYQPDIVSVADGLNEFVIILDRIIAGTEKDTLK